MQKYLFLSAALGALLVGSTAASAQEKLGDGMVIYFQMGGSGPYDTLARPQRRRTDPPETAWSSTRRERSRE
jgi:hypothetical protein